MGMSDDLSERLPGYRFPVVIIQEVIWLRFRFDLSLRDIPDMLAARGIYVSHQTVKDWCDKFGNDYAKRIRRRRRTPGDKWHLDEMVVQINGVQHYLWRAIDQHGVALDILVTKHRKTSAARRFLRRLMSGEGYVPRVLITDKLRSYSASHGEVMASVDHRAHKGLNNRAENAHQRTRVRERTMKRFKSTGGAQRFCAAHDHIYQHFRTPHHMLDAATYRHTRSDRHDIWTEITGEILADAYAATLA